MLSIFSTFIFGSHSTKILKSVNTWPWQSYSHIQTAHFYRAAWNADAV